MTRKPKDFSKRLVAAACFMLFAAALLAPAVVSAQLQPPNIKITPPVDPNAPLKKGEDIYGVVGEFARYIAVIFWILATASAFYAGYLYFGAAGNPEILRRAHRQIWYTIIAIVIGLMAWGLPVLVRNLISPGSVSVGGGGGTAGQD